MESLFSAIEVALAQVENNRPVVWQVVPGDLLFDLLEAEVVEIYGERAATDLVFGVLATPTAPNELLYFIERYASGIGDRPADASAEHAQFPMTVRIVNVEDEALLLHLILTPLHRRYADITVLPRDLVATEQAGELLVGRYHCIRAPV